MNESKTDNDPDIQAASKALAEAEEQGTVPWESIKASLDLGWPPTPASPGAAPRARKAPTNYIITYDAPSGRVYLVAGPYTDSMDYKINCEWHWTSKPQEATRFSGVLEAIAFKRKTQAWLNRAGWTSTLEILVWRLVSIPS